MSGSGVVPMPSDAALPPFHLPWCFGCGPDNELGLKLAPRLEGDKVVADITFAGWFQGGPGVVHGGGIAAALDDLMGFVPVAHHVPAVTARLEIDYRRPVSLGTTIRGEAWLSSREGRKLWARGVGRDEGGAVCVEAKALYLSIGVEHFTKALDEMPAAQRERLARYRTDEYYP